MLLAIIECCELLIPTAPVNTAKLIFEKAKGTALNEVFPYNIKANPHIFVIKIPGTPSQIPNAPSHATNTPSQFRRHQVRQSKQQVRQPKQQVRQPKQQVRPILIYAVL